MILYAKKVEVERFGDQFKAVSVETIRGCAGISKITYKNGDVWYHYRTDSDEPVKMLWQDVSTHRDGEPCDEKEFHELFAEMAIHNREHF